MARTDAVQVILEVVARMRVLDPRLRVTYEDGWMTRGNGLTPRYMAGIVHDTTTPSSAAKPFPTQNMLRVGRVDLDGPLCNFAGPYCTPDAPWIHVVAAFPANHAGASGGRSMGPLPVTSLFNNYVLGLEIDFSGLALMPEGQMYVGHLWSRAAADVLAGGNLEYIRAHFETSITGKIDISFGPGKSYDMAAFRRDAAAITAQEDDMPLTDADYNAIADRVWHFVHPDPAKNGPAWAIDRLAGIDYKTQAANDGIAALPGRVAQVIPAPASPPATQVTVDATAVANALANNQTFLKSLARAVNDDAAARLAS